ncbi:MAG: DUF2156 domain-containing protein, partial [Clostridia bacterium]|nr:DUF2156 domain-containing protein [Clostridia bacterium]
AIAYDTLILKQRYFDGPVAFLMPLGENAEKALLEIKKWCDELKIPFKLCFVTEEQTDFLKEHFEISAKEEKEWADYLYKLSDLSEKVGKKYNGQRNHINAFNRLNPDYSFKPLNCDNFDEAKSFFMDYNQNTDKASPLFYAEQKMVYEALENFESYKMTGLCLYVKDKMAGFTAGEIVGDTLYVHIEKANTSVRGAYQMLVKKYAEINKGKAEFINREEDMGDEGLRKSKLSYQPIKLISKYTVDIM